MCVLCRLIVYSMGDQLAFDWDRLENFLITRDRLVGNKVTNVKCQSWASHVEMQCTMALVSDAQIEGASVTPKSWLSCNNKKTYYNNTLPSSVELVYGQPLEDAPKNVRDQPTDG